MKQKHDPNSSTRPIFAVFDNSTIPDKVKLPSLWLYMNVCISYQSNRLLHCFAWNE